MQHQERLEKALARSCVYRFLSALFTYPDDVVWSIVQGRSTLETAQSIELLQWNVGGFRELQETIQEMTQEGLASEHTSIFGLTAAGDIPPYEGRYCARHLFQETQCLADIAGFYLAFGLESAEACRERPDHIAVELEFMHALAVKEAYALNMEWGEQTDLCREAQAQFLGDHLGRWAPTFLRHLKRHTEYRFFEQVAEVTASCLELDGILLGATVARSEPDSLLSDFEPEGSNFSCGAGACGVKTIQACNSAEADSEYSSLKEGVE